MQPRTGFAPGSLQTQVRQALQRQSRDQLAIFYNQLTTQYERNPGGIQIFEQLRILKDELADRIRNAPWIVGVAYNPYLVDPKPIDLKVYLGYGNIGLKDPNLGYIKKTINYMERYQLTMTDIQDSQVDPQEAMLIRDLLIKHRPESKVFVKLQVVPGNVFPDQIETIRRPTTLLIPVEIEEIETGAKFPLYSRSESAKLLSYSIPISIDPDILDYLEMYRSISE